MKWSVIERPNYAIDAEEMMQVCLNSSHWNVSFFLGPEEARQSILDLQVWWIRAETLSSFLKNFAVFRKALIKLKWTTEKTIEAYPVLKILTDKNVQSNFFVLGRNVAIFKREMASTKVFWSKQTYSSGERTWFKLQKPNIQRVTYREETLAPDLLIGFPVAIYGLRER